MSDIEEESRETVAPKTNDVTFQPSAPSSPPAQAAQVENQPEPASIGTGFGASGILRRWKRDDLLKRSSIVLNALAFLFSLLAFIVMASNKHGHWERNDWFDMVVQALLFSMHELHSSDWKNFDNYEEYRYVLAIAILSTLYTGFQILRQIHESSNGKPLFQRPTSLLLDFIGDQIMAYLLISAASSAVPLANRMKEIQDNNFTETTASAISMAFLAFFTLAVSAIISGHKLSNQSSFI